MTSQGYAYSRFRRSLLTGSPGIIPPPAAELPHISLADALRTLVVLAESGTTASTMRSLASPRA